MVLFILIDAFGWDWLKRLEFLDEIAVCKGPTRTVLGYSPGAIGSMLTGKNPSEHGHWNLFFYSPQKSPFGWMKYLRPLNNPRLMENKYIREVVRRVSKMKAGYTGTFSLPFIPFEQVGITPLEYFGYFDICEKKWIYQAGSFESTENMFDFLAHRNISHEVYTYDRFSEEGIIRRVSSDIKKQKHQFYFLYFTKLDEMQHMYADKPEVIVEKIRWYEKQIRGLYGLAKRHYGECKLVVCSDHGMAEVKHDIDLVTAINGLGLRFGQDYVALYDSTMARFWFFKREAEDLICNLLAEQKCGSILSERELADLGIFFEDKKYGDIIFLVDEGYVIRPGMMGSWQPTGMHGYHPKYPSSDAIFLCNWEPERKIERITDVFGVIKNIYE